MLEDEGDVVRGLGFVTMYSAWVEDDVDDLLRLLTPIEAFNEKIQRYPISRKLKHAATVVERLDSDEVQTLPGELRAGIGLFEYRNKMIHGRIYVDVNGITYVRSGRPNAPTQPITSAELYNLANKFHDYRARLIGPQYSLLPRAIAAAIKDISKPLS